MIADLIVTSFAITGIHVAFWQGNICFPFRRLVANGLDRHIGKKGSRLVQKPLWDCLPCMSSVWTIVLSWEVNVIMILAVCGCLAILETTLSDKNESANG